MVQNGPNALDIAIIGGGITGLVCAAALAKRGVQVDIYEAKVSCTESRALAQLRYFVPQSKFGEIGAGVGIGMRPGPVSPA